MTAHVHRTSTRTAASHLTHPLDHSPEVLLLLSALLVLLAGPVSRAVGPGSSLVVAVSALALAVGIVLAVVAAARLLRPEE